MSYSVTTNKAKEKLVKARAGVINLPPIAKMYFGKDCINTSNIIVECTPEQVELNDKILKKISMVINLPILISANILVL